ncbi:hypothetical protein R1flu_026074 [Riccia fluitans]|uniref:Uncharacterized protein n=1 Tax=Riccia fluitans TaxID=41844 RepID=A0ABD1XHV8_9MARC
MITAGARHGLLPSNQGGSVSYSANESLDPQRFAILTNRGDPAFLADQHGPFPEADLSRLQHGNNDRMFHFGNNGPTATFPPRNDSLHDIGRKPHYPLRIIGSPEIQVRTNISAPAHSPSRPIRVEQCP